jgi:hypothetical protein
MIPKRDKFWNRDCARWVPYIRTSEYNKLKRQALTLEEVEVAIGALMFIDSQGCLFPIERDHHRSALAKLEKLGDILSEI